MVTWVTAVLDTFWAYNSDVGSSITNNEPHNRNATAGLNKLRAAVLGANDGIVSIAGLVVGVAGATNQRAPIFTAGLAGVLAGALSMAAGEYISVSSQRDTERAMIRKEKFELDNYPDAELSELTQIYIDKGLSPKTAEAVAKELSTKDAYAAHLDAELAIDPDNLVNPWHAAVASASAFLAGAILPMAAILIPPQNSRVIITFISVITALAITGALSARFGKAPVKHAVIRVTVGGALAMAVTFGIGHLVGSANL
jgi:vacuolar iron transporter family protein